MKPIVLVVFVLAFSSASSADWNVVPCDPATIAKRAQFGAGVRAAAPGMPLHARIPFPRTDAEVIADLTTHLIAVAGDAVSSRFHGVADGMRSGAYTYEVLRVADWTPTRCAGNGNAGDFYFLILIRDFAGREIARASVSESGKFGELGLTDGPLPTTEPIATIDARFKARGIHGQDPQYVHTWGTLRCGSLQPCAAVRNREGIFILQGDEVWLLPVGGRIRSMRDRPLHALTQGLREDERVVTLGADATVVAKRRR